MKSNLENLQMCLNEPNKMLAILSTSYLKTVKTKVSELIGNDIALQKLGATFDPSSANTPLTYTLNNGVAEIDICGMIMKGTGLPKVFCDFFDICDLNYVDPLLIHAASNPEVTSVILNVNSPGGYLTGVQTTAALVKALAAVKETVVYSDTLNASAAYWISSQASSIVAAIDAELGSVGVFLTVDDWSQALSDAGVKVHLIKAGTYKAIGLSSQPLTTADKAYLQADVNQTWETFKATVTSNRNIAQGDMEGQTFIGGDAVNKGFSDGIGDVKEIMTALTK